jgi:hypothetical protein
MIRFILAVLCLAFLVITAGSFANYEQLRITKDAAAESQARTAVLFLAATCALIVALGFN